MPKKETIKTRNSGTMTEAAFFAMIKNSLRKLSLRWIPMKQALELAQRPSEHENKLLKYEYQCAKCLNWFPKKDVEVDHIIPCGSFKAYEDIGNYVRNMLPENASSFMVLCKEHHLNKSLEEQGKQRNTR